MKKLFSWLKESNRIKHLLGGFVIGLGANDFYCATYTGGGVVAALELKDHLYGGKWDWIDIAITMAGVAVGHLIRRTIAWHLKN